MSDKVFKFTSKQLEVYSALISGDYSCVVTGGAIRGGKTFGFLLDSVILAMSYPNSRWVIVRRSVDLLKDTTIPSFGSILELGKGVWNSVRMEYRFTNGSVIKFFAVNEEKDRGLNRLRGLEANGIIIEELEGISYLAFRELRNRVGSWRNAGLGVDGGVCPMVFGASCNPSDSWVKREIYNGLDGDGLVWEGGLREEVIGGRVIKKKPIKFIATNIYDNEFLDSKYVDNLLGSLSERDREVYINGNWNYEEDRGDRFWYNYQGGGQDILSYRVMDKEGNLVINRGGGLYDINRFRGLVISIDVNVMPYISIGIFGYEGDYEGDISEVSVRGRVLQVGEVVCYPPYNKVGSAVDRLLEWLSSVGYGGVLNIVGDRTMNNRVAIELSIDEDKDTFASLFIGLLRGGYSGVVEDCIIRSNNPSIIERNHFINDLFGGWGEVDGLGVVIDEGCIESDRDYCLLRKTAMGGKLIEKERGVGSNVWEKHGHFSDVMVYAVYYIYGRNGVLGRWRNRFDVKSVSSFSFEGDEVDRVL